MHWSVNVNPQGGPPGQTQGILTEAKIGCQIPLGESTTQCQNSAKNSLGASKNHCQVALTFPRIPWV